MALEKTEVTKRATVVLDDEGVIISAFRTVVTRITDSDTGRVNDVDQRDVDLTAEEMQTMFGASADNQVAAALQAKIAAALLALA